MTTFLGAAGACPEIPVNGRVWRLGHPTQRAKAELEKLAVQQATDRVLELRPALDPPAYAAVFAGLMSQIQRGHFKTWGAGWQEVVFDPANAHLFLLSLLRECHPEATADDVAALAEAEPDRVQAALAQVVPGFFEVTLAGMRLTPDQRAAAVAAIGQVREALRPAPPPPTPATDSPASSTS